MSRTFEQAVTLTRLSAGTRFNRLAVLVTEPDNTKRRQHDPATVNTSTQQINVSGVRRGDSLTVALDGDHVYAVGDDVYVTDAGNIDRFVAGRVTAAEAGSVTIEVKRRAGIGAASDWVVIVALGLLVEGEATNRLWPSEDFSNSNWTKINLTVSSDAAFSPDGNQNADNLSTDGVSIGALRQEGSISASAGTLNISAHIEKTIDDRYHFLIMRLSGSSTETFAAQLNSKTGIAVDAGVFLASSGVDAEAIFVEDAGNFWRIVLHAADPAEANTLFRSELQPNRGTEFFNSNPVQATVAAWGLMFGEGKSSSYIKTTTAPATRAPDVVSQGEVGKWLAEDQGAVILDFDFQFLPQGMTLLGRANSGADGPILIGGPPNNRMAFFTGGSYQIPTPNVNPVFGRNVLTISFSGLDVSVSLNGGPVSTTTLMASLRDELLSGAAIGGRGNSTRMINGPFAKIKALPYALTESEAIEASKL